ncbi:MAG: acetyltransferase [bacterium]
MDLKKILIFSAGEGSQEIVRVIIEDINRIKPTWEILGFVDINREKVGTEIAGYPVFGESPEAEVDSDEIFGICGVMNCELRQKIIEDEIEKKGFNLASLIHPSAMKLDDFQSGPGLIMYPGVKVSYGVRLGKGVFINYNSMLGHHVSIDDYTFIAPSVTINARCLIGKLCMIGSGATFVPGVSVGDKAAVGVGTTIFSTVKSGIAVTDFPRKITK